MKNKSIRRSITITQSMVGLKAEITSCRPTNDSDYIVNLKFREISDEGLEVFGLTEDDVQA